MSMSHRSAHLLSLLELEARCVPAATFGFGFGLGDPPGGASGRHVAADAAGNSYIAGSVGGTIDFDPGPGTTSLTTRNATAVAKYAPDGSLVWVSLLGTGATESNGASPLAIAVDANGSVYTVGRYSTELDFDPGPGEYLLDGDAFGKHVYFSKLDADGNFVWASGITSTQSGPGNFTAAASPSDMAVDSNGVVYVVGSFHGQQDFNPGPGVTQLTALNTDAFLLKLDASGSFSSVWRWGGLSVDLAFGVDVDAAGSVYTTSRFGGSIDADPGPGITTLTETGFLDSYVSKLNPSGNLVWAAQFGGEDAGVGTEKIEVDATGAVYTVGTLNGTADFDPGAATFKLKATAPAGFAEGRDAFMVKLNPTGTLAWARRFGSSNDETIPSLVLDAFGFVYTTGQFVGKVDFDPGSGADVLSATPKSYNQYVVKLDPDGNEVWATALNGVVEIRPNDIAVGGNGHVFTTGSFHSGTIDFDPGVGTVPDTAGSLGNLYLSALAQTSGPLDYTTPSGNGADALVLRRRKENLEIFNSLTRKVVASKPFDEVSKVTITGADGESDLLTIDYSGGPFRPPEGIVFAGGTGGPDALYVRGADRSFTLTDTTLSVSSGVLVTLSDVEAASLTGGKGNNALDASAFSGSALLDGGAGNDTLLGALGGGILLGKGGIDLLTVGTANTTVNGGGGIDVLAASADANLTLKNLKGAKGELLVTASNQTLLATHAFVGVEAATLVGGGSDNVLDASAFKGFVSLDGGDGHDRLIGGAKTDSLLGGNGNDTLTGGGGIDLIDGGTDTDTLIESGDFHFTLTAITLETTNLNGKRQVLDSLVSIDQAWLVGGKHANRLDASQFAGSVTLEVGLGNDTLTGGAAVDSLLGGDGTDSLTGGASGDVFSALDGTSEYSDFNAGDGDVVA